MGVLGPYLFALRASNPEGYTWNGALFSLTTLNNKPCALAPVATPVGVLFLRMYVLIMRAIKPPLISFLETVYTIGAVVNSDFRNRRSDTPDRDTA